MADGFADQNEQRTPQAAKEAKPAIPQTVSNRMARRIAISTGIPTVMGMGVFVASYLLISQKILDIPPGITLVSSGGCFLLGLVGLSYGIFSSSWLEQPGSILGFEQIKPNIKRLRSGADSPEKQQR
ncbi:MULTISPECIES: PAM68 family protein [unclassified Synechococcus]|uniref:PAM68 family protein n=1 Tax=unclassified Synechococcus TaxID=2626047 RepID=UPI0020CB709E|nr:MULTISPECIES: PAM68 family protein [unclassified Synechococcus]MCP9939825.1 PAM68 family protein [Synechococcus sp. Cruz CV12-2-Slac-r]MCX5929495.1 PAM68 family protein [Synechococcus sp. LacPavin_0920_WC12_MAG_50_7]